MLESQVSLCMRLQSFILRLITYITKVRQTYLAVYDISHFIIGDQQDEAYRRRRIEFSKVNGKHTSNKVSDYMVSCNWVLQVVLLTFTKGKHYEAAIYSSDYRYRQPIVINLALKLIVGLTIK